MAYVSEVIRDGVERVEMMEQESRIALVLNHLAWLAERIDEDANEGRAYDAALLTYNAAAMLRWRFMAPVSSMDTIDDPDLRAEATELIDDLVTSSRKAVAKAKQDTAADESIRAKLGKAINKVTNSLPGLLRASSPVAEYLPELEAAPNLVALMEEFLQIHSDTFGHAIVKGTATGAKAGVGPDAALSEAIAALIYAHDAEGTASMGPDLRQGLAQIAAGFFKTAVDMQPDDELTEQNRLLRRLADSLVAEAGENTRI